MSIHENETISFTNFAREMERQLFASAIRSRRRTLRVYRFLVAFSAGIAVADFYLALNSGDLGWNIGGGVFQMTLATYWLWRARKLRRELALLANATTLAEFDRLKAVQ